MTRQKKIEFLVENFDSFDNSLIIRSCYYHDAGRNCSECEKCRRTILGLCLAGLDPNKAGYNIDQESLVSIRHDLEQGDMKLTPTTLYFWQDLQNRSQNVERVYFGDSDFFDWFRSVDLSGFLTEGKAENRFARILADDIKTLILRMPYPANRYLWASAKPVKAVLDSAIKRFS